MRSNHRKTARVTLALALSAITSLLALPAAAPTGAADIQRSARSVEPKPADAFEDRGKLAADGCMVEQTQIRYPKCVYGKKRSKTTVVLFGDSQAMQWFPPLLRLARRHDWKLIGRTRAGCPPAAVRFASRCDRWRKETLRRIERYDKPDLVVTGTGVVYGVVRKGRRLSPEASAPHMRKGLRRTLWRLRRTGARVAVMKTLSWSPDRIVTCVKRSLNRLRRCAFKRKQPTNSVFEARAAKAVRGAKLVDARDRVCLERICPAVIDGKLVYRDPKHLSATFSRTLAGWLGDRLPAPR